MDYFSPPFSPPFGVRCFCFLSISDHIRCNCIKRLIARRGCPLGYISSLMPFLPMRIGPPNSLIFVIISVSRKGINMGNTIIDTEMLCRKKATFKITAKMKLLICNTTPEDELNHILGSHVRVEDGIYDSVEDDVEQMLSYYDSVIMS